MKSILELLDFSLMVIDKPSGPTSGQVSAYVRERLGLSKTSHMGTLDPAVSGVLPLTLNRACKLSPYFLKCEKEYIGIMRLHAEVSDDALQKAVHAFTGTIRQRPPVRSNVKRVMRERTIMTFDILERSGNDIIFNTRVEAGTYIRTLIHDLGKTLGGAHMLELRRTAAGSFKESEAHTLYEFDVAVDAWKKGNEKLLRAMLLPAAEVLRALYPVVEIGSARLAAIKNGKPIHAVDLASASHMDLPAQGTHVVVFCDEVFVEMARMVCEGDVIAVPEFVFN